MEDLNVVNATQEPVVEAQTTATDDGVTTDPAPQEQPQEPAKPVQSAEENAAFAKLRKEYAAKEAEANQKTQRLVKTLESLGYAGTPEEIADSIEAQAKQITVDELRSQRQMEQERLKEAMLQSPEYMTLSHRLEELQRQNDEHVFMDDMAKIKSFNPKETAATPFELGDTFSKMRAMGIDVITAYEFARSEHNRLNPAPPSMGDINTTETGESEFYTLEQLKSMSQEDMRKNWKKVQASRQQIFK